MECERKVMSPSWEKKYYKWLVWKLNYRETFIKHCVVCMELIDKLLCINILNQKKNFSDFKEQNFPPLFYEVMNAFVQFALSNKDTCTHNNTARARLKLRKEYFLLSSSYLLLMLWRKLIYVPKEIEIKTHSLRDTFFLFHHQITINIYMNERFPICGELFMWVLRKIGEFTHACWELPRLLITDNDAKNFFHQFLL